MEINSIDKKTADCVLDLIDTLINAPILLSSNMASSTEEPKVSVSVTTEPKPREIKFIESYGDAPATRISNFGLGGKMHFDFEKQISSDFCLGNENISSGKDYFKYNSEEQKGHSKHNSGEWNRPLKHHSKHNSEEREEPLKYNLEKQNREPKHHCKFNFNEPPQTLHHYPEHDVAKQIESLEKKFEGGPWDSHPQVSSDEAKESRKHHCKVSSDEHKESRKHHCKISSDEDKESLEHHCKHNSKEWDNHPKVNSDERPSKHYLKKTHDRRKNVPRNKQEKTVKVEQCLNQSFLHKIYLQEASLEVSDDGIPFCQNDISKSEEAFILNKWEISCMSQTDKSQSEELVIRKCKIKPIQKIKRVKRMNQINPVKRTNQIKPVEEYYPMNPLIWVIDYLVFLIDFINDLLQKKIMSKDYSFCSDIYYGFWRIFGEKDDQ